MLALVAAATVPAQELRLRALLLTPAPDDAPAAGPGLRGEARVIVHADGQARLDLVSWALPEGPAEVALQLDARGGAATPLLVVPLERDADEGRVIGARFRLDANALRRLQAGEGQVLLTSRGQPVAIIHGALQPHPRSANERAPLHAAD